MLTDDGYRQLMKHAKRLAQEGHGELAQHLRDAIDLRAEVEALRADAQTKDALLDRAHDLLEFIGCSPEGARNDILMAKMLQRDIDAARAVQGDKT